MNRFIAANVILLLVSLTASQASAGPSWITDESSGCKVWNSYPKPGEWVHWSGGCRDGLAQGAGVLEWYKGGKLASVYNGDVREGFASGHGVLTVGGALDAMHDADISDGYAAGSGEMLVGGERYDGEFANNLPNGYGVAILPNGARFEGEWTNGCFAQGNRKLALGVTKAQCGF